MHCIAREEREREAELSGMTCILGTELKITQAKCSAEEVFTEVEYSTLFVREQVSLMMQYILHCRECEECEAKCDVLRTTE